MLIIGIVFFLVGGGLLIGGITTSASVTGDWHESDGSSPSKRPNYSSSPYKNRNRRKY